GATRKGRNDRGLLGQGCVHGQSGAARQGCHPPHDQRGHGSPGSGLRQGSHHHPDEADQVHLLRRDGVCNEAKDLASPDRARSQLESRLQSKTFKNNVTMSVLDKPSNEWTETDLEALISEGLEEQLELEYKRCAALAPNSAKTREEIC